MHPLCRLAILARGPAPFEAAIDNMRVVRRAGANVRDSPGQDGRASGAIIVTDIQIRKAIVEQERDFRPN